MSHVFRQDYVRGPFRRVRVPLRRRRRRGRRLYRVRLSSVMELVVLVLDPVEFEKVDGQQDDAQQQHEADGQRHGKPSEPHPDHRISRRKSENPSESSGESNVTHTHTTAHTSVTSHSRNRYVSTAYLLTADRATRDPRGPEKVGRRPTTRRPALILSLSSTASNIRILYICIYQHNNIIITNASVCVQVIRIPSAVRAAEFRIICKITIIRTRDDVRSETYYYYFTMR